MDIAKQRNFLLQEIKVNNPIASLDELKSLIELTSKRNSDEYLDLVSDLFDEVGERVGKVLMTFNDIYVNIDNGTILKYINLFKRIKNLEI